MKKTITTQQRLKDYALWYYFRYFPSNKKLENKLLEKTEQNRELVMQVLSEISHLLQEKEIIRSKIKNYLFKNKNLNYIKQKLREKLFPNNTVEEILNSEFLEEGKSILDPFSVRKKIENYKQKGKSITYIKQKLIERSEDKSLVESWIKEAFWNEEDLENLKKEYKRLEWRFEKQKIVEKLLRKWFKYGDIKNIIQNY